MLQKIFPFVVVAIALSFAPKLLGLQSSENSASSGNVLIGKSGDEKGPNVQRLSERDRPHYVTGKRTVRLKANRNGHFYSKFRANGRNIDGLIDTGATYVAMNESTARSIGIRVKSSDFKYRASTANGVTPAAKMTIDRMQIGAISVPDVAVFVLKDSSLSTTLIGMSFMSKLESFQVKNGELIMTN